MKSLKNLKVEIRTEAKNANTSGNAIVDAGMVFNFDGFLEELNKEQKEFINSLNHKEFKRIPDDMLDMTTSSNFRCYLKRV